MAYDAQWNDNFSNRPNHRIETYVRRDAVSGNSSRYWWQIYMRRTSGAVSYVLDPQPWWAYNGSYVVSGSKSLNFSSSVGGMVISNGYSPYIGHNADGYLNCWFDGKVDAALFGLAYAGGTLHTDRIPKPPDTPARPVFISVGTTDVSFLIQAPANGGSAIRDYTMQISDRSNFTASAIVDSWVSGSSVQSRGGLPPGTQLYARYRARNDIGSSGWSSGLAFKTKSGVFVGYGGSFPGVEALVGYGGSFVTAEIWIPDGAGNWVLAGA